jgi:Tol biopolymer transport system component
VVAAAIGACSPSAIGTGATPAPSSALATPTPTPALAASLRPSPTASPGPRLDGQIVFEDAGDNFQHTQVWIQSADGSNVHKIVSDDFTDGAVSLAPDGTTVVFYRAMPKGTDMVIANVDGSKLHELDTGSGAQGCDAGVEGDGWSPDGTRLAFTRTCFADGDFANGAYVGQGIWTTNLHGTGLQKVTDNPAPKPCPPPSYCAHVEDHRAGWSPDGKELVFERIDTSTDPERAAIFTIGVDGKHLRQVTPWALDGNDPDWSPDGTLIAFNASAEPSATQNIYTIHPDGTGLAKLTNYDEDGQATYHPSWSPDGQLILFSHRSPTDGGPDFYVMGRDGSNGHVIAYTPLNENHGTWGPNPAP